MKVLSLFDGISCGMVALDRVGIPVEAYFASEIEENAILISKKNHPDIIQLGDVTKWREWDIPWGEIDLVLAGSPCQGFSSSGKKLNFDDPRSRLLFVFVDVLNHLLRNNPGAKFLLENVNMRKEWRDVISELLGVEPVLINSALLSAQNRVRLYWTNISTVSLPIDRGIVLDDILEDIEFKHPAAVRGRRLNKATIIGRRLDDRGHRKDYDRSIPITQCLEVRATNTDKSNCLTTVDKDNVLTPLPPGRYPDAFKNKLPFRYYTTREYERLQTLPDGYTDGAPQTAARKAIGNCWTVDVIAHILTGLKKDGELP